MKLLYLRNGPYKPQINNYNMQEIGFCKALTNFGWDCDILYYSDRNKDECFFENAENHSKINILWRTGWKISRTGIYPSILKRNFLNQYDLIISADYSQLMSVLVCFFAKKVFIYTGPYYNLFKIPFVSFFYDLMFVSFLNSRVKHIFCKSKLALEYLQRKGFTNMSVLGVGFDSSRYETVEIQDDVQLLKKKMQENDCILFVGSLDERKNFPFVISIFEKIKSQKSTEKTKLVLIGKGNDEYVKKNMAHLPSSIMNDIISVKRIENAQLKFIYPLAKCLLLPSKQEIFGMVLLEAMFFGCVPITSKNGGSATLIENGKNGFVLESFDELKWINIIQNILLDDLQRKRIVACARATIEKKFLWSSLAKRMLEEYEKID